MQVTIDIPDDLAARLVPTGSDMARTLIEESAAAAYRDGRLSTEQLRRLLGMESRFDVDAFLTKHSICDYTRAELEQDLLTLHKFNV